MAVEKRQVRMVNKVLLGVDSDGNEVYQTHEAIDYVPVLGPANEPGFLDAYVADAKTRWALVQVVEPEVHDAGPAGDDGDTHYPDHLIGA